MGEHPPHSRVILGVSWASGSPEIRVRESGNEISTLEPLAGTRLNYRSGPAASRVCLGRTPFRQTQGAHTDCLNTPEPGSRLCTQCSISDATFASNLHHAHTKDRSTIDPAIAEHLRQPNLLYLAAFRDGSVKVGTTTAKREGKRLLEQGAWQAAFVARATDGYAVRDIEDRVTAELDIAQSVSMVRKLDGMASPTSDAGLKLTLAGLADEVDVVRLAMQDSRLSAEREEWTFPGVDDTIWGGLHRYPLRLDSGQHDLEVLAACGRMVVVARPDSSDRFIADLGQVFGVQLELGDYESDELAVQDSLF